MTNPTTKRTVSFYMTSEVQGKPIEILKELDAMFKACASYLRPNELKEIQEAYPLANAFIEAI